MFAFKDVNRRRQTPAHVVHQGECVMRSGPEHERTRGRNRLVDARVCRVPRPARGVPGFVYLRSARVRLIINPRVCVCVCGIRGYSQIYRSDDRLY